MSAVLAWRLCDDRYAATMWSGEGARRAGGRWNGRGVAVVYVSSTRSLAALEQLVHLIPLRVLDGYVFASITFDEGLVERVDPAVLPRGWDAPVPGDATRSIGDRWAAEGRSLALAVPGAVMPGEWNYLLNPMHPAFAAAKRSPPEPHAHDPRLA